MIKHIWSVLCRESTINQDDNNLSIRDVLEALQINLKQKEVGNKLDKKPEVVIPINYEITSLFIKEDKEKEVRAEVEIIIYNPANEEISKNIQEMIMPSGVRRMRTRMKITGLKVKDNGDYIFRIYLKEEGQKMSKTVAEIPLEVVVKIED